MDKTCGNCGCRGVCSLTSSERTVGCAENWQPVVRRGHWVENLNRHFHDFRYNCDICGGGSDLLTNFCPHCGSAMEETDDDDDLLELSTLLCM